MWVRVGERGSSGSAEVMVITSEGENEPLSMSERVTASA